MPLSFHSDAHNRRPAFEVERPSLGRTSDALNDRQVTWHVDNHTHHDAVGEGGCGYRNTLIFYGYVN